MADREKLLRDSLMHEAIAMGVAANIVDWHILSIDMGKWGLVLTLISAHN